jgi:hypothetical protein
MGQLTWVLEVWIGEPDYLVRCVELNTWFPGSDDEPPYSMHTVTDYYDFNEPIDIQPPDTGS